MNDYIPRKALLDWVHEFYPEDKVFVSAIINAPAADVTPVRHGRIIETIEDGHMKRIFSCCETDFTKMTCWMTPNYCPNCGAKMDGGSE